MSIDKKEPVREPSEDSMELNSPTPEAETGAPQENIAGQQKRKGGRKPVRIYRHTPHALPFTNNCYRFMPPPRNASNATARPRPPSESDGQNTSSNWKKQFESMKPIFTICKLLIGAPRMSV
jgi:hypothetical protein